MLFLRFFDQVSENVVKNLDLFIAEPIRISYEKVGDPTQRLDALVLRAALDRILQLGNKGLAGMHHVISRTLGLNAERRSHKFAKGRISTWNDGHICLKIT